QGDTAHGRSITRRDPRIGGAGLIQSDLGGLMDKSVQPVARVNRRQARHGQVYRRNLALAQGIAGFGNRQGICRHLRAHSTTFGTAKKPSRASGAFFRTWAWISPSVTTSARRGSRIGVTETIGSTPSTSTSFSSSMKARMPES